jgi:hypothetical protein
VSSLEPHADAGSWPDEMDVNFYADSALTLPGMGERGSGCGEWYPRDFCSTCGEPHFGASRCQQRSCPDCWSLWSANRAVGITARLSAARYVEDDGADRRAVHAVVSPPEGSVRSITDLKRAKRDAYRLAEEHGVRGGVAVTHGDRVKPDVLDAYRELFEAGATEQKVWRWVRDHARDWRSLTYWSPHFHIIGLCRDFEANSPDNDGGWVVERLSTMAEYRLTHRRGYESVAHTARYLLSHASFDPQSGSHSVTWFGSLANNAFSPESVVSKGALGTIERYAEEAVGAGESDDGGDSEGDEPKCERDRCEGVLKPIWEAGAALQSASWCDQIGREQERRLRTAWEWAIGDVVPPPGLCQPRSEEECAEAFASLL